jgi:hypothetical protein
MGLMAAGEATAVVPAVNAAAASRAAGKTAKRRAFTGKPPLCVGVMQRRHHDDTVIDV